MRLGYASPDSGCCLSPFMGCHCAGSFSRFNIGQIRLWFRIHVVWGRFAFGTDKGILIGQPCRFLSVVIVENAQRPALARASAVGPYKPQLKEAV